jgi:hypothetical protein
VSRFPSASVTVVGLRCGSIANLSLFIQNLCVDRRDCDALQTESSVIEARFMKNGAGMKKKKLVRRAWSTGDVRELKSLAKKKVGVAKISKALKRTIGATAVKAHQLGVSLDTRH